MSSYEYTFKFIIIGATGTGKSSLLHQFTEGKFYPDCSHTIGVEFATRVVEIMKQKIKIQIWDTAGQERFRAITRSYFRGAVGVLLVYDVTRRNTFHHLNTWLTDARNLTNPDTTITLIANKVDIRERAVTREEGETYAAENDLQYLETSAKTNTNVEECFISTARIIYQKVKEGKLILSSTSQSNSNTQDLNSNENFGNSKGCC
ncbi:rab2a member ras oncogene family [Anaeramoeba ignava]|uniref:Rab2a member ras oncogene family n=1 Tax=Anaeramoeba ignava TaxID=1746090 RepID=A0A9Q0LCC5_ANAIG|nr:rab2a member ras oncogene family [Anaeramoeba ignava]